jgi:hypothetical protein
LASKARAIGASFGPIRYQQVKSDYRYIISIYLKVDINRYKRPEMDPIKNPFSPGAGSPPPELVGRDPILE